MGGATNGKRKGGRKGHRAKNKSYKRSYKLKHYGKDHDVVHAELKQEAEDKQKGIAPKPLPFDEDLPGGGQFYALATNRYFINQKTLDAHLKTKEYKRTLKRMLKKPFDDAEQLAAAGRSKEVYVKVDRAKQERLSREEERIAAEKAAEAKRPADAMQL